MDSQPKLAGRSISEATPHRREKALTKDPTRSIEHYLLDAFNRASFSADAPTKEQFLDRLERSATLWALRCEEPAGRELWVSAVYAAIRGCSSREILQRRSDRELRTAERVAELFRTWGDAALANEIENAIAFKRVFTCGTPGRPRSLKRRLVSELEASLATSGLVEVRRRRRIVAALVSDLARQRITAAAVGDILKRSQELKKGGQTPSV